MNLDELLNQTIDVNLIDMIISNPRCKDGVTKVKIRPVIIGKKVLFQKTEYIGTQVFHHNDTKEELIDKIQFYLCNNFKQAHIETKELRADILVSKKGAMNIKVKKNTKDNILNNDLSHNRNKKYILEEGKAVDFLVDLGVMTKEGKIVNSKYDKFKQINRFLEFIEDILPKLDKDKEQTIIDFGCGKSYLTFAMYYYLKVLKGYNINVIGLDLKKDVIEKCNRLKEKYGYDKLNFYLGDIASYEGVEKVDMVVTLHACDTATDHALYKAVNWGAKVILSVPCCQHELNKQIKNDTLSPLLSYGIIKERMSALMTDAMRAELLKQQGYEVQILEFIDIEHTPKNLLIRAVYTGKKVNSKEKIDKIKDEFNMQLTLDRLLNEM